VEELAILVNGEAGLYCQRHGLPAFYRVQPPAGLGNGGQRLPPAARFSLTGAPHAGVACERYVQVTSPIRRFPDLVMQRQIAAHATRGEVTFADRGPLEAWMWHAEQRMTTYHQLERRLDDYWKRRYLAQNLGLEVRGVVRRNGGTAHARVWLEELLLEADAHLGPSVPMGWAARFRVIAADPDRETVEVVMIEK
jgi:exoribonuclease-2